MKDDEPCTSRGVSTVLEGVTPRPLTKGSMAWRFLPYDSVDSFFDFLYNQAISRGIGNHSLTFIVKGSDTLTYIQNLSNDEYLYRLIDPVANYIGRSGWTGLAWEYNWYPLWPFDEYYYVEYQLNFV